MIGTILSNRYKIVEKLGSGGMAWVYLAEDLNEQQQVAVKVLYPQHSQDLSFLHRFMQEARLAMGLSEPPSGPHVVPVLNYGSDRETHYLVMEYVEGQDLGQTLNQRAPLSWQEALQIARQVALALDQAHRHGIVHRDIKPGNIMLGQDGIVRVLDFGIARARGSPELTLSGFVGSPHYAAPEQAMGEKVDIRADIYSLGVVLYRMLSGELPFQGNTPWALANQHIASPPPSLREADLDLSEAVVRLVDRAMAKRPEDRFQTPVEMAQAIEAVLAGQMLPGETAAGQEASLEELYQHAQDAMAAGNWQKAVDLLNQITRGDANYRDAAEQIGRASQEIRLAALYQATQRMLQLGAWEEALLRIDEIVEIRPGYRDVADLKAEIQANQEAMAAQEAERSDYPTYIETPSGDAAQEPAQPSPPKAETPPPAPLPPGKSAGGRNRLWLIIALLVLAVAGGGYALLRTPGPQIAAATSTPSPSATATAAATAEPSPTARPSATRTVLPPAATAPPATATTAPTATDAITVTPTPSLTPTSEAQASTSTRLSGQIAFPRFDTTRSTYDVYVCQAEGTNCRRIVAEASQPDFLPDGKQIVVHSWQPDNKGIVLHVLSEQRIWQITGQIEAARPSVDAQGKTYAYHSRQEVDRQPRLYRTFGTETRPIVREGSAVVGLSPAWTPDGQLLYSGCLRDSCGIILMWADGSHPRQVVAGSTETNPEAAPDGQAMAFMSQRDGNWEVYVTNLDGSGLQRLTHSPGNDGLPTWSPDGRHIAFVSDRSGRWAVWVMAADGSGQRRLFDIGGPLDGQVRGAAPHELYGWVEERISWAPLP